jgi:hypothetical protein
MTKPYFKSSWLTTGMLVLVFMLSVTYWTGCDNNQNISDASLANQEGIVLSKDDPAVQSVMTVQDQYTSDLMSVPGVVGTATGMTDDGKLAIMVYLESQPKSNVRGKGISASGIPTEISGIPVVKEVTGKIKAMDGGAAHKVIQTPPIQLGTSGGWRYDLANGYCCGGTLGSLVLRGGNQYVLSNYHVLEADIVSGGNSRVATAGDPVVQPGLIDVGCNANSAQDVATLSGIKSLPSSNVDAAIAQVIPGMVRTDGAILDIGTISATTVSASLNQAVKKSGRTSGLTRSTVSGLNATISVAYENECAGGSAFTKTFTGQIVIKNRGSKFLISGDSGSLMVQDVTTNPKAVGLLFAGSSTTAIANPIGQVLSFLNASMVGQ